MPGLTQEPLKTRVKTQQKAFFHFLLFPSSSLCLLCLWLVCGNSN